MPENPYQPPTMEEFREKEPPSAGLIADLLDALPPPVLKRVMVIVLCYFAVWVVIALILGQIFGYIAG